MKDMAGNNDLIKMKQENMEARLRRRKENIQKLLLHKRISQATKMESPQQKEDTIPEVIEVEEVTGMKGYPNLSSYHRKTKKKSKKRCWKCKSTSHFKKNCPNLRCFYCHKLGHIKAVCFFKKIMELCQRLDMLHKKKEHKKKVKQKKDHERMENVQIYKKRLLKSDFVNEQGTWKLQYEKQNIGVYIGIAQPINLEDLRHKTIKWKNVDKKLLRDTPIESTPLLDGFLNTCGCGNPSLDKKSFISHIWTKHRGMAPTSTFLNQPPWIYEVLFDSDELELLYCRSTERLS